MKSIFNLNRVNKNQKYLFYSFQSSKREREIGLTVLELRVVLVLKLFTKKFEFCWIEKNKCKCNQNNQEERRQKKILKERKRAKIYACSNSNLNLIKHIVLQLEQLDVNATRNHEHTTSFAITHSRRHALNNSQTFQCLTRPIFFSLYLRHPSTTFPIFGFPLSFTR